MSAIEAVAAVRTDDRPWSIEILVANVDHTLPDPEMAFMMDPLPAGYGLITLELAAAQALRTRLDVVIDALRRHELPREAA